MQSALTQFGLGPLSFWELVPVFGGGLLIALVVIACLPGRRRTVNPRLFSRLLHRVHDRREQLFLRPPLPPRAWHGTARERFLEAVRERVRACAIFHRDSTE